MLYLACGDPALNEHPKLATIQLSTPLLKRFHFEIPANVPVDTYPAIYSDKVPRTEGNLVRIRKHQA
jgi:hypothetical protein